MRTTPLLTEYSTFGLRKNGHSIYKKEAAEDAISAALHFLTKKRAPLKTQNQ